MGETRGLRGWAATHFLIATTVNYIPGQSSIQLTQSRRRGGSNTDRGDRRARVSSARAGQTTEPSAGRKPATPAKRQDMNASNHCRQIGCDQRPAEATVAAGGAAERSGNARRASARTKNGQSSRADGGSMGPNALDRENRDAYTCVRSGQSSPGRRCVPRQWQCGQNAGSPMHRTPLRRGWDCPRSLAAAACRGLLG